MQETKYHIELTAEETIDFRIKDDGGDWLLMEVIATPNIVNFLKKIATTEAVEIAEPAAPPAFEEAKSPIPSSHNTPAVSTPVVATETSEETDFTDEQIKEMQDIKDKMKLVDNDELDPFVQEWSFGQGKTWEYLTDKNINDFINFMKNEYLG